MEIRVASVFRVASVLWVGFRVRRTSPVCGECGETLFCGEAPRVEVEEILALAPEYEIEVVFAFDL